MKIYFKTVFVALLLITTIVSNAQISDILGTFEFSDNNKQTAEMPTPSEYWSLFESDSSYLDIRNTGDIAIFLGNENTCLTNPVIFVDGFDPGDQRPIEGLYELGNQQNMIDSLRSLGDDVILLNFHQGADYIQRNAMLFVSLIDTIQTILSTNGTLKENPQIAVIGPSMGGLITRYAITYMEQNNMNHHIRNWISFDSPHKGANIPLGLQHWLRFFAEEAESDGAIDGLSKINSIAAKQMLLYHYSATADNLAGPNPLRNDLINELNSLGFPLNTRIVAVVNGSGYSIQQEFDAGEQVVEYEFSDWSADLTGNIWAIPDESPAMIFEGLYNTVLPLDEVTDEITVSNTLPYDNASGGDTPTFFEIAEEDPGYGDIIDLYQDHCFIPTISSLCVTNTTDPNYNVNENLNNLISPFDTLYFPLENQEHAEITEESFEWFKLEVHNYSPYFTFDPIEEIIVNNEYILEIHASDINYWNNLTIDTVEIPNWLIYNSETNEISGIPSNDNIGLNQICLSVSDGLLNTEICFDVNVINTTNIMWFSDSDITIYPNPLFDKLNIELPNNNANRIRIINLQGQIINEYLINSNFTTIDTKHLKSGIYMLSITNGNTSTTKRFLKI